jgi:hypothetical protein
MHQRVAELVALQGADKGAIERFASPQRADEWAAGPLPAVTVTADDLQTRKLTMIKSEVFQSKYLKAEDLAGKPLTVRIMSAPLEKLKAPDGREQQKVVLYFDGTQKRLPVNQANWDSLADICGEDSDDWPGRTIVLYPTKTQMGGKTVDCIRIRAPKAPSTGPAPAEELNDDIPFN